VLKIFPASQRQGSSAGHDQELKDWFLAYSDKRNNYDWHYSRMGGFRRVRKGRINAGDESNTSSW
jgi:hypothetical protein